MKYRVALILTLAGFSVFPSLAEPQGALPPTAQQCPSSSRPPRR